MKILDACCGGQMFWFDKENKDTTYMDIRKELIEFSGNRKLNVNPNIVATFEDMPFADNEFDLIVFDPPHLIRGGDNSWLVKKYGKLDKNTWPTVLKNGFDECLRVLKPTGTLIFKWNENQIKLSEILKALGKMPLFGNKRSDTHWLVFNKELE